jgi:NDP-sugar pyrophosphorylase family protein
MKAVVLIGGLGTRLRPLTYASPKSLLPIANVPFFERLVEWFGRHGVTGMVLALSNLAAPILDFVDSLDGGHGIEICARVETSPLGSGGALKNCADLLDETFILFNGDILTDLDLSELVSFHRARGAVVTATVNEVDDPSGSSTWTTPHASSPGRRSRAARRPSPAGATSAPG